MTKFYASYLDSHQVEIQLGALSSKLPQNAKQHNLASVLQRLWDFSKVKKSLTAQFFTLASLILVMPVTNAVSEGSLVPCID